MIKKHFIKESLQNRNSTEVVDKGAILFSLNEKNIIIKDIITKGIGICIKGGKMNIIIPSGTPIT